MHVGWEPRKSEIHPRLYSQTKSKSLIPHIPGSAQYEKRITRIVIHWRDCENHPRRIISLSVWESVEHKPYQVSSWISLRAAIIASDHWALY
jgi:hypothetical protein